MTRAYVVLNQISVRAPHSDVGYEEVALVTAPSPPRAMREALRQHGEFISPPMPELVVIPATAIQIVRTDAL